MDPGGGGERLPPPCLAQRRGGPGISQVSFSGTVQEPLELWARARGLPGTGACGGPAAPLSGEQQGQGFGENGVSSQAPSWSEFGICGPVWLLQAL